MLNNQSDIPGQLNPKERKIIAEHLRSLKVEYALEVGTWEGGGSTLVILNEFVERKTGHLWGIESDRAVYERMLNNISEAVPNSLQYFTPIYGYSQDILPSLLQNEFMNRKLDLVFLDGGNNPMEQIEEFKLLDKKIRVGGCLLSHDAKLRKGKWLVPYLRMLDHWETRLHDVSEEGLFEARKLVDTPTSASLQKAEIALAKWRLSPVELIGALLPSSLCGMILSILPTDLRRRLGEGR